MQEHDQVVHLESGELDNVPVIGLVLTFEHTTIRNFHWLLDCVANITIVCQKPTQSSMCVQ